MLTTTDTGTGQTEQGPDYEKLTCSPWIGLHYREEEGQRPEGG